MKDTDITEETTVEADQLRAAAQIAALKPITRATVLKIVKDSIEDTQDSDAVLAAINKWGPTRKLTTKFLSLLPGGSDKWSLVKNYGWTDVRTVSYTASRGQQGCNVMLYRSEQSQPVDIAWVRKENAGIYEARYKRNEKRLQILTSPPMIDDLVAYLTFARIAVASLIEVRHLIPENLFAHGKTLEVVRHPMLVAAGLYNAGGTDRAGLFPNNLAALGF